MKRKVYVTLQVEKEIEIDVSEELLRYYDILDYKQDYRDWLESHPGALDIDRAKDFLIYQTENSDILNEPDDVEIICIADSENGTDYL